jgi:DNA-binding beta-propeller fold protein YncE
VWAISADPARVIRVDPRTREVAEIPIAARRGATSPSPIGIAATRDAVWVLNANTGTVSVISTEHLGVTGTIEIGIDRAPRSIVAGGETVWVANADGTLTHIEADDGSRSTIDVGHALADVAPAGRRVWLTTRALDNRLPGGHG